MRDKLVKLAVDLAKGSLHKKYSREDYNEALRKGFADILGDDYKDGKIDRRAFRKHKHEIFSIIEDVINETVHEGIENQFEDLVEYRNLAWGDTNIFRVPANNNFRVSLVSDGNGSLRRNRLMDGQEYIVEPETYAVAIYEEMLRFLAGRIDWAELVEGVSEAFVKDLKIKIYDAVQKSFGKYNSTYHLTTTGAPTEDEIVKMAMHIEARTGAKVSIFGTKLALRMLNPDKATEDMLSSKNKTGIFGYIAGIPLKEIEQSHDHGTDDFAIDNDFILLLPESPDRMIKVVNEGDSIIQESQAGERADMQMEYSVINKFGVGIITSKAYGFIKFLD